MDEAPGWLPDPEDEDRQRFWSGSDWTDQVRPVPGPGALHLPEHVSELRRALAAATADIDAVEDRLSLLFERTDDASSAGGTGGADGTGVRGAEPGVPLEPLAGLESRAPDGAGDQGFAGLDAALAAEEPEPVPKKGRRGPFRRRS